MLISSPYNLQWGTNVTAKVVATNFYGSVISAPGGGAIILTSPDPPANVQEDLAYRTKSALGIKWEKPQFSGGSAIINY